jgi:hypothetical protein
MFGRCLEQATGSDEAEPPVDGAGLVQGLVVVILARYTVAQKV